MALKRSKKLRPHRGLKRNYKLDNKHPAADALMNLFEDNNYDTAGQSVSKEDAANTAQMNITAEEDQMPGSRRAINTESIQNNSLSADELLDATVRDYEKLLEKSKDTIGPKPDVQDVSIFEYS